MNPPNTMQYLLLPGGARKARQATTAAQEPSKNNSSESAQCADADENKNSNNNNNNNNGAENAHADDKKSSNANDNADRICWTCHKELVCLKKNICAGCFKARYCDEECRSADWARHGEYCVLMQQKIRKKKEAKKLKEDLNALKI